MSTPCKKFTILDTGCECLLQLEDECGHVISLNLSDATVRPYKDSNNFHIQTPIGGAKVDGDASGFTADDIAQRISECNCRIGTVIGVPGDEIIIDWPKFEDYLVDCTETVEKGLPVRVICDDSADLEIACTEDGELVYIDLKATPPVATLFDGTPYLGTIVQCDREFKWVETCFTDGTDQITRVVCWNVDDISDTSTLWILQDGTIVTSEPADLLPCEDFCRPYISEQYADSFSNSEEYNKINIHNPTCGLLQVTTDVGSFFVPPKSSKCVDWECNIDPEVTFSIDNDDYLEEILVTIQRTK